MYRYKYHLIILLALAMLSLNACRSRKQVSNTHNQDATEVVDPVDSLFNVLKQNEFDYEWLRASFKANAELSANSVNISGQIRMRKDSIIWMSISPALGIEMLRLKITTDSVFMLNKLKKTFIREHIDYINTFLGTDLDFDMVQSLLIGNDFTYYSPQQFQIKENEHAYIFNTVNRRKLKRYIDTADVESLLIQKMHMSKINYRITHQDVKLVHNPNKRLKADYSEFEIINNLMLPTKQDLQIKGSENIRMNLKLSKVIVNEKQNLPFKFPKSYTQL